jgi:quinoprotein glucose dehydrogenase
MASKSTITALITVLVLTGFLGSRCNSVGAATHGSDATKPATVDWPVYGGQLSNDHYSELTQVNRSNVNQLKVAWTYDTGEPGGLETSPLIVGRVLYAYTPSQKVIALDAVTGKLLWKFDSGVTGAQPVRGLSYWTGGKQSRLLAGVMNFLYALNPATGKPIPDFGEDGRIDLRTGLSKLDFHLAN